MSLVKIVLHPGAIDELLKSPEVQADLAARGKRIAAAAGEGVVSEPFVGKTRARNTVRTDTTDARIAEATNRTLTRAIDAGR